MTRQFQAKDTLLQVSQHAARDEMSSSGCKTDARWHTEAHPMSSQPREATHLKPLLALALQIDRGLDVTTDSRRDTLRVLKPETVYSTWRTLKLIHTKFVRVRHMREYESK
jgi:hypothetical protein